VSVGRAAPRRAGAGLLAALALAAGTARADAQVERGAYLATAAGCVTCHTEDVEGAAPFAGGRALASPFGTFYAPNITPDPETGIGRWSADDLANALHAGTGPDGAAYFPAFPYPSYTGMSAEDARALHAYLMTLAPVRRENRPHELPWYLGSRLAARAWQWLFFTPARFAADAARDADWNRGAYLVRHLGHCGECHTPRNALGAPDRSREMAGTAEGPEGRKVPNITPDRDAGIGRWAPGDLETFLEIGMLPDGDFAGAGMGEVIDENTGKLTPEDRRAIAAYLAALPALPGPR